IQFKKLISDVVGFKQAEDTFKRVNEGKVVKILSAGPNARAQAKQDVALTGKCEENWVYSKNGSC
ncbi:hypothetical protein IWW34DRAFT_638984, partial [Fusarium oxysporum f. sp. albedinis]